MTSSAIYEGTVRHRRWQPVANAFRYRLFMLYLDLSELDTVFQDHRFWSVHRPNLASLQRRDHLGDFEASLDGAVRGMVASHNGTLPHGPIRLLTHLRYFGHCFNPVSFYYCFDPSDRYVETIVAEVNNTPWHERHCYVLPAAMNQGTGDSIHYRFAKDFHVSPFMAMDQMYDWRFTTPGESLRVHMENQQDGEKHFDATLDMARRPLNAKHLNRVLWHYPFMTLQVVAKIYWQALKLRARGARFYPHPKSQQPSGGLTHG